MCRLRRRHNRDGSTSEKDGALTRSVDKPIHTLSFNMETLRAGERELILTLWCRKGPRKVSIAGLPWS